MNTNVIYKKPIKYRHELKHLINHGDDLILTSRLRKIFNHDKNSGPSGIYKITSLYFDSPDDKALREKIDGVDNREKFRLRYYGDSPTFVKLEKKIKRNGMCGKRGTNLTLDETNRILKGDIDFLIENDDPLKIELYSKMKGNILRPKTIVVYEREAFTFLPGNTRITLDRHLKTGLRAIDFLNSNLPLIPANDDITVLEVKYDEFLPDIVKKCVQIPNRKTQTYSKYAVCRRFD